MLQKEKAQCIDNTAAIIPTKYQVTPMKCSNKSWCAVSLKGAQIRVIELIRGRDLGSLSSTECATLLLEACRTPRGERHKKRGGGAYSANMRKQENKKERSTWKDRVSTWPRDIFVFPYLP